MSGDREAILAAVRRSIGTDRRGAEAVGGLEARLSRPPSPIVPAHVRDPSGWLDLFRSKARAVQATVDRVDGAGAVPEAVWDFLGRSNRPLDVVVSPDPLLRSLPWESAATLAVRFGPPGPQDAVTVTHAGAGIAETGSVMLASGAEHAATASFLPETNIVLLREDRVVGTLEQAWERFRAERDGVLPRAVHFVTGPSRTADIAQELELGAHGPRRLHILLVGDGRR